MKTRAIRIYERGGPEVMRLEEIEIGDPGPGEVRIRQTAIGLNFNEPGHRSGIRLEGRYETPFPMILGTEGAGVVEAVGPGVRRFREGDRVAYWYSPPGGSYTDCRNYPIERLVKLPDGISEEVAAAALCKGMTVNMLVNFPYKVKRGDTILHHAAAGGCGHIMSQWLKHLGATVIGTVGTDEKAVMARSYGCDHTVVYTREDFLARVREITKGKGVPAVYDSVGIDTLASSLKCLSFRGVCVLYGISSGRPDCFDTTDLSRAGSVFLTRPSAHQHHPTPAIFLRSARKLLDMILEGHIRIYIGQRYRLEDVARAHVDIEERRTIGSSVLIP